jgi:hypothetical protein
MTFTEMILLIASRNELMVSEKINSILTDKFLYHREPSGSWEQMQIPEPIQEEEKFLPLTVPVPEKDES